MCHKTRQNKCIRSLLLWPLVNVTFSMKTFIKRDDSVHSIYRAQYHSPKEGTHILLVHYKPNKYYMMSLYEGYHE